MCVVCRDIAARLVHVVVECRGGGGDDKTHGTCVPGVTLNKFTLLLCHGYLLQVSGSESLIFLVAIMQLLLKGDCFSRSATDRV